MIRTPIAAAALGALLLAPVTASARPADRSRWRAHAAAVIIARDDWGIAHVHGHSDADTVFGAIYAQAEDDFPRIEANLLTALGRTAEAKGPDAIWQDLRQRLYVSPEKLEADYAASPPWLRTLMIAWADGLNAWLAAHPETKPQVLTRFEPWMALSFTEGSIGGDIESVDLAQLAAFYGETAPKLALEDDARLRAEPTGSNGVAIAPKLTRDGHALLLINPHTSFFFRSELGMESDAGLHAYGASTWGQFFLYQGFNEHLGWMHTSSGVDSIDEFAETVTANGAGHSYRYGTETRPVTQQRITIRFRQPDGKMADRVFTTYATHHGPIVRRDGDKWIAFAMMDKPVAALEQSWLRTRATSFATYLDVAKRQANSSNNTILAAADGTIAYLHPQFVPQRDNRFDYRKPVDGSDPATGWHGLTPIDALPKVVDPGTGWLYNSNDAPWRAAGADSPRQSAFPKYMDEIGANPRGVHAITLLSPVKNMTPQSLMKLAYDPWLPAFDPLFPPLFAAWEALPTSDPKRADLAEAVELLRGWDKRWSATSEPTTIANYFGEALWNRTAAGAGEFSDAWDAMLEGTTPAQKLEALAEAVARMKREWGTIHVAWGEVNRFQRVTDDIAPAFSDALPSNPVPFASARWGSLASFGAHAYPGTRRWYGTGGNSFVAVVEFGPKVRAWAVTAGGESGHPGNPHFNDEAARYASGDLRSVYFYDADLSAHTERRYHPEIGR